MKSIGYLYINNKVVKQLTSEEFIKRAKQIFDEKYSYEKSDLNNRDEKGKVIITCPIHGDFYPTYRNFILNKCGCLKCYHHIYEQDEFINDLKKIYGDKFLYNKTIFNGHHKKTTLICSNCGKEIKAFPKRLLYGTVTCDNCSNVTQQSKLERDVENALKEKSIEYIQEYTENWLIFKQQLKLDFYLPKYNIAIECQGRFHFEPFKENDEKCENNLQEQIIRDKQKFILCQQHNIELLYYSNIQMNTYHSKIYNSIDELMNKIIN